jgi:monoamine oxidase
LESYIPKAKGGICVSNDVKYQQPNNPTDEERRQMIRIALEEANHLEDFDNIIELLSPPQDITTLASPEKCKGKRVGIVGGGLAGLSSAYELRKLGFDITIFEMQESRIGGRVYTYYFDDEKQLYGELGAMRFPVIHETTWHYINLFGLNTRPFIQNNENAFIYVRNRRAKNDPKGLEVMKKIYPQYPLTQRESETSWQELLNFALTALLFSITPEIRRELLEIREFYSEQIISIDYYNIRQVMEMMGLSEGAMELLSCVAPFIGSLFYSSYSENLLETYTVDIDFRYEVIGGMVQLPLAFYHSLVTDNEKLKNSPEGSNFGNVVWKNGKMVTGIRQSDFSEEVVIEFKDVKSLELDRQSFDFIICAIPFSSLRNVEIFPMFSTSKMQAIKEVTYVTNQKTFFKCRNRFWEMGNSKERILGGGSYTDLPITSIWYPSDHAGFSESYFNENRLWEEPGVLLASYGLTQNALRLGNLDEKIRIEKIKREVEAVHGLKPGFMDTIVEDTKSIQWDNEQGFWGGFCYYSPEQMRLFSYAMIQPEYDEKVYFAGEHTSSTHGWQQGALHSGMEAANAIAIYCNETFA